MSSDKDAGRKGWRSPSGGRTPEGVRWLSYPYPLRPNFTATLELPIDLTADEAERLCAMLNTLPLPESGPS